MPSAFIRAIMNCMHALLEHLYLRFNSRPLYTVQFPVLTQATNAVATYYGGCLRSEFPILTVFSETEGWILPGGGDLGLVRASGWGGGLPSPASPHKADK